MAIPRALVTSEPVADESIDQPNHAPRIGVEDDAAVDLVLPGGVFSYVGDPQLIQEARSVAMSLRLGFSPPVENRLNADIEVVRDGRDAAPFSERVQNLAPKLGRVSLPSPSDPLVLKHQNPINPDAVEAGKDPSTSPVRFTRVLGVSFRIGRDIGSRWISAVGP